MEIASTGGMSPQIETISNYTAAATKVVNTETTSASFKAELEKALGVTKSPQGYAYIDKYGFSHVVEAYETATRFVKSGTDIYGYNGKYLGGYAVASDDGDRMALPIPGSIAYGNGSATTRDEETGVESVRTIEIENDYVPSLRDFLARYPGYLTLLDPSISRTDLLA